MFARLGRGVVRHPWRVIGVWIVAAVAIIGLAPKATIDAVTPAFLFLACCGLAVGVAFSLFGVETHGKPLPLAAEPDASPQGSLSVREQPS